MKQRPETSGAPQSVRAAEDRRARRLRLAFSALLVIALAQVVWWLFDQTRLMDEMTGRLNLAVEQERVAAERLLDQGVDASELERSFRNLEFDGTSVSVSSEWQDELDRERRAHLNQYRWEGGFFLTVLLLGLVVMSRAISREVELRRRQENFLAAVTHELKSPLASVRLGLETMQRRGELSPERRERVVSRALGDTERLSGLIDNVLATSRFEEGAVFSQPEDLQISGLVTHAIASTTKIDLIGCTVHDEVSTDLWVHADAAAAQTVLRNLLDNAVEAVRGADDPTIRIEARSEAEGVVVAIMDNGSGFEPELAERLFEKFFRPGDELTRQRAGTGLGLYLVRRLVELDGGRVEARSGGAGRGARFEVRWPEGRGRGADTDVALNTDG